MKQILLLLFTFSGLSSFAQYGAPDVNFGTGGKVITPVNDNTEDYGNATLIQPDGKIIVIGSAGSNFDYDFALVRYNPDGSLDTDFGGGGKVITNIGQDDTPNAIARQSDGKIVVAGYTSDANTGSYDFVLVRYNPNGSLDTDFGGGGKVITDMGGDDDEAYSILIQPDGKIVIAGYSSSDDTYDFALARYNSNGSLDTDFGGDGKIITDFSDGEAISSLVLQPDGKIVAAGGAYKDDGGYDFVVLRYNPNGSLDTDFGSDGEAVTDFNEDDDGAYALALQGDGKIVAAGTTTNPDGDYDFALVRYNPDGSLDTDFDGDGKVITDMGGDDDEARAVHIQSDGKILVGGFNVNSIEETSDFALIRYANNGTPDPNFGAGGKAFVDFGGADLAFGMGVYGTRIYLSGFTDNKTKINFAVAALQNDVTAPLPLSLTSFAAAKQPGKVQLNWTTVNEQDIASYEVIRSGDGRNFSFIGSVKAAGNSSAKQNYTFTDAQPLAGINHYRLRIVEAGGRSTHSLIVAVKMDASGKLALFPNPVRNSLNVQFTSVGAKALQVQDAGGRVVKTVAVSQTGDVTVPVDVSGLQKGIYFVRVAGETARFIKE